MNNVENPSDLKARPTAESPKGPDIQKWIGSGKGLFKTPEEVVAFIRAERDRWDERG